VKKIIASKKQKKDRRLQLVAEGAPAPKTPGPATLDATIEALAEQLATLKNLAESESAIIRERDHSALSALQPQRSAIAHLLREATQTVRAAQRAVMTIEEAKRDCLLAQCQEVLGALGTNQRAIAAAKCAGQQRIQSLLQARQRAQGAVLVYGPDGQARAAGRWSNRRDLAPDKA
jgi:hypothetical protein